MRKVFIVISTLVILATIIGFAFLFHDALTYDSSDDDKYGVLSIYIFGPMAVFILLFEFTISHGILYFTSFEWKTKLKDILNGIAIALVIFIPVFGSMVPEELTVASYFALILLTLVYSVIVIVERSRALINKIRQRKNTENSQVNA